MRRLPALLLSATIGITACAAGPDRPEVGETWQIEGVDSSGVFGTITVELGETIDVPAAARVVAGARGILVHISYEPARANDSGYGAFDWMARLPNEETLETIPPRVFGLVSNAQWPVEPTLGTRLPGGADALAGWMVVAVTPDELEETILLRYQPLPTRDLVDPETVREIVIHAP